MNYTATPKEVPKDDFILACQNIPDKGERARIGSEIASILKQAKPGNSNIQKEEWEAIKSLNKDKSIMVRQADKSRITVVMETEQYVKQVEDMLSDTNTYELLKKDLTEKKK